MSKVINVYENGKFAIKPEDCPIYAKVKEWSMVIYGLDGNITLIPKQKCRSLEYNKIYVCHVDTGIVHDFFWDQLLFINHPKYGIIADPSYKSYENCCERWNQDDDEEPRGFKITDELMSLDNELLINFINKIFTWVEENNNYLILKQAWTNCFGSYFGEPNINTINIMDKEELVYLILNCENYMVVNCTFSFWELDVHGIFKSRYTK